MSNISRCNARNTRSFPPRALHRLHQARPLPPPLSCIARAVAANQHRRPNRIGHTASQHRLLVLPWPIPQRQLLLRRCKRPNGMATAVVGHPLAISRTAHPTKSVILAAVKLDIPSKLPSTLGWIGLQSEGFVSGSAGQRRRHLIVLIEPLERRTMLSTDVLSYHNDLSSTGVNSNETILTRANVNQT